MTKNKIFIIDSSVLRAMIENDDSEKAVEVRNIMREMKGKQITAKFVCSASCLKRAIWKANPNTTISYLQEMIEFLEIIPSNADYRNRQEVMEELISIAKIISK